MSGLTVRHDGEQIRISDDDGNERLVPREPKGWSGSRADWILGRLQQDGADVTHRAERAIREAVDHKASTAPVKQLRRGADGELAALLRKIEKRLMAIEDVDALLIALAVAVSVADPDGEPLWLMLVGAGSTGKSETMRILDHVTDGHLASMTPTDLLSQRTTRKGRLRRAGLLAELGDDCNAFVTFGDASNLLTPSDASGAGALRAIHDGRYSRTTELLSLSWEGRLTVLAAANPIVDPAATAAGAPGPQWLLYRLPELSDEQRDDVQDMVVTRTNVDAVRAKVAGRARTVVKRARGRVGSVRLGSDTRTLVKHCAAIAGYGRATVQRGLYGDMQEAPHWEEPGRLTEQLLRLARSLSALDVGDDATRRIVRRVALSCVPPARAAALNCLEADEWTKTSRVAANARLDYGVTERALHDWAATRRVVESRPVAVEGLPATPGNVGRTDTRPGHEWRIASRNAARVADLLGR